MRAASRVTLHQIAVVPQLLVQLGGEPISANTVAQASDQFANPHRYTDRSTRWMAPNNSLNDCSSAPSCLRPSAVSV